MENRTRGMTGPSTNGDGQRTLDDLGRAARTVQDQAREKTQAIKEKLHEKSTELKQAAERRTEGVTTEMGEWVERVAGALRTASDALEESGEGRMSAVTVDVAEQVERVGGYLRDSNPKEMIQDLERMARRNPAVFVGATFAAGLLLGRFLRSSAPEVGGAIPAAQDTGPDPQLVDESDRLTAWAGKPLQPTESPDDATSLGDARWPESRGEP